MLRKIFSVAFSIGMAFTAIAQDNVNTNKFRQLGQDLPTPNVYRNAAGAPGHKYYQNRADYKISVRLEEDKHRLYGEETITYINNSPDALEYLWLQLDQNVRAKTSDTYKITEKSVSSFKTPEDLHNFENPFDGGFNIDAVTNTNGSKLSHTINKTMMRVDLAKNLAPGQSFSFKVKWWYNINDRMKIGGRSGYEFFEENENALYTIAQFYPRMCAYNDVDGWQNKQFLGNGEFTLTFGDYDVEITVPSDHVVASTGTLQNASQILTSAQRSRWAKAQNSTEEPVIIVTQEEAEKTEKSKAKGTKTWKFHADNVRDFAFATSRKFIWDAMAVKFGNRTVMAMSYYPKEGNPLWEQYSTKVVAHTLKTYSKHTFDYPYPVAISVHADRIGMEYPMICFNYGRPEKDGTYPERLKYGMIGVIIHEVGHNFFPMIVNSDERQWTWMDEGLNTFLQFLTEQELDREYPSRRGPARNIVNYMKGDKSKISPIMTNSESIWQFGNNAYGKPATALNILRETVMGRELFDHAFKTYAQRWMFKQPMPADFFRTMEDASGVDLDWFWRSWFFTTDHVDIAMQDIKWFKVNTQNPEIEMAEKKRLEDEQPMRINKERNQTDVPKTYIEKDPKLNDFYTTWERHTPYQMDIDEYNEKAKDFTELEKEAYNSDKNYYEVTFKNIGGIPMPLIVEFTLENGQVVTQHIPAEIWKKDTETVTKVFVTDAPALRIVLDPRLQTADTDISNNSWPTRVEPSRFDVYKKRERKGGNVYGGENPMQKDQRAKGEASN